MPRFTEYRIVYASARDTYEMYHGALSFDLGGDSGLHYWMEHISAFSFCSPTGHNLTVRKEQKKRGDGYWYIYKRIGGKVRKQYVGDRCKLDLRTLARLAQEWAEPQATPQAPPPPPPRKPTLTFTGTLTSALCIYGFPSTPGRKALLDRYRELAKQYHPDAGGLHQDMVAVNLAYDYLKKFIHV
jgi:hypothetical protein